ASTANHTPCASRTSGSQTHTASKEQVGATHRKDTIYSNGAVSQGIAGATTASHGKSSHSGSSSKASSQSQASERATIRTDASEGTGGASSYSLSLHDALPICASTANHTPCASRTSGSQTHTASKEQVGA